MGSEMCIRDSSNVEGHEEGKIRYFVYNGGSPKYVQRINEVEQDGYRGIDFASTTQTADTASG